jgi:uncharacterized protein
MKGFIFYILLIFFYSSISSSAQESDFPSKPNPPRLVNDFAGLLSAEQQREIEYELNVFNDSTSIEISVVIIKNIGDYAIDDYAAQLGDKWGIGKKQNDNGVLLLIAPENRKAFIATGYGMEGVLPDSRCKRIIQSELIPQFRKLDYYDGIKLTVEAIMAYSASEYKADPKGTPRFNPLYVFLFILFTILLIGFVNRNNKGNGNGGRNNNGGMRGYTFGPAIGLGMLGGFGRGSSGGFGGSGDSGGGFGGFGGGGFGGGGAGGDW